MTAESALSGELALLRLYTLAGDQLDHRPLVDALLDRAHGAGLAGATVLRGSAGFGWHGFDTWLEVTEYRPEHQPVVVELVDHEERLTAFLSALLEQDLPDRLITLERAEVLAYRARGL